MGEQVDRAGLKETEIGPVPEHWEVVRLKDVGVDFFSGGTPSTDKPEYWNGDIPWTTSAHINGLYLEKGAKNISPAGLKNSASRLVPKGNLLIGTRVGVGKVTTNLIDVAISQDLTGVIVDKAKAHLEYIAYALSSESAQERFRLATRGTTIKGIPRGDMVQIPVPLPPLPEQRAIAQVLRTVQRAKETTERVIAATRELKKSLMRHLFTYGPVPVDQVEGVRLKETEIGPLPEHWEVVRLGQLEESRALLLQNGFACGTHNDEGVGVPQLRPMNVNESGDIALNNLKYAETNEDPESVFPPPQKLYNLLIL